MNTSSSTRGFICAIFAYLIWGILPLYWKLLIAIDSVHILAFRILFSLLLVSVILLARKNFRWLAIFKDGKKCVLIIITAILICLNWGIYIWAVNSGHTLYTSLGYYINPLATICLGLLFFREHLKTLQWTAVILAAAGVIFLTVFSGRLPWVSLLLVLTFSFYGLLKKKVSLTALESLGAETIASVPICFFLLFFNFDGPKLSFAGIQNLAYLSGLPLHIWALLAASGLATMLPLYLFAKAAKMLQLSALGFCQFLSPTLTFILGVFVFSETFPFYNLISFIFIWTAAVLYIISLRVKT